MPPLTRRAAKAQNSPAKDESTAAIASANDEETRSEDPIAPSNKRRSLNTEKSTPRRSKLEVRTRDEVSGAESPNEIRIPSSTLRTPRSRSSPIPDSEGSDIGDEADQTIEPMSASRQLLEETRQMIESHSRLSDSGPESTPLPKNIKPSKPSSSPEADGKSKTQSHSQETANELEPEEEEATPQPKATKSTHVVFGDDDDVDKFVAAATDTKEKDGKKLSDGDDDDEDERDESDDEAPEAVSTAAAAKETLKSARAAIEAAEQYAAATKKKRQARDNLLKQQAEKRKRTNPSTSEKGAQPDDDSADEDDRQHTISKRQRRTQKLPDMLPAEFLTDSSDDDDEDNGVALKKIVKRPQKITFETAMQALNVDGKGGRSRDQVVGSTRYRVLGEQGDGRLAPTADKNSLRSKDALLRRGRERVTLNKRRGFFVRK